MTWTQCGDWGGGWGRVCLNPIWYLTPGSNTLPKVIDDLGLNGLYGIGWEFNICVYICTYVCMHIYTHKEININICIENMFDFQCSDRLLIWLVESLRPVMKCRGFWGPLWFPFLLCHPLKIFISWWGRNELESLENVCFSPSTHGESVFVFSMKSVLIGPSYFIDEEDEVPLEKLLYWVP